MKIIFLSFFFIFLSSFIFPNEEVANDALELKLKYCTRTGLNSSKTLLTDKDLQLFSAANKNQRFKIESPTGIKSVGRNSC